MDFLIDKMIGKALEENHHKIESYGLNDGKAGWAILYFILFRFTGDEKYKESAQSLLDNIGDNIMNVQELGYGKGLAGIGVAIEWLVQEGFIEGNTDEILEDVDDTLYKAVVYAPDNNFSLQNGTLGKIAYFLKRYQNINRGTHRFKTICHQECLVILTDELRTKIVENDSPLLEFDSFIKNKRLDGDIVNVCHALILLSKILPIRLNTTTIEDTLYELVKIADQVLLTSIEKKALLSDQKVIQLQTLAYSYYLAGIIYKCQPWQAKSVSYLDCLLQLYPSINSPESQIRQLSLILNFEELGLKRSYSFSVNAKLEKLINISPPVLVSGNGELLLTTLNIQRKGCHKWNELLLNI